MLDLGKRESIELAAALAIGVAHLAGRALIAAAPRGQRPGLRLPVHQARLVRRAEAAAHGHHRKRHWRGFLLDRAVEQERSAVRRYPEARDDRHQTAAVGRPED